MFNEITKLIGHFVKEIYRNYVCMMRENVNSKFYFSEKES